MRGSGLAVIQRLSGAIVAFAFQWLVAHMLGADGAGLYFLAFQTAWVVSIFCRGGLDLALVRFVAARLAMKDFASARAVYRKVLRRALAFSATGTLLLALAAYPLARWVFDAPDAAIPILVMAACVAPIVLYRIHGEALRGVGRIQTSQFVLNLAVPLTGIAFVGFLAPAFGLEGAIASQVLAHAAAAAIGAAALIARVAELPETGAESFDSRELDRALGPLWQLAVFNLLQASVPTLVLGATRPHAEVGIFNVAQSAAQFLTLILLGHNALLGPEFATLSMRGDRAAIAKLAQIARTATRRMTLEAAPLWLLFTLAPALVMRQFGAEFEVGADCLAILALGQLVNVATGSIGLLLVMSGRERSFRGAVAIALLTGITLNALLAPAFGLRGAAAATAAGVIVQNVLAAIRVRRSLGFWVHPFHMERAHAG